jgi:hypothetical protein
LRRAELVIIALGLTGCMKIYPDPELPDVKVSWGDQDCRDNTRDVAVTLTGLDTESTTTTTVACADLTASFPDVARERFHVAGALLDLAGNVFITSDGGDVDLRNGFNQETGLYFEGFSNFRLAWTFDGGSSCRSLGIRRIGIYLSLPAEPDALEYQSGCLFPGFSGMVPPETYTAQLRGFDEDEEVVAASPESAPFVITENGFVDLGTLTISPCGAACP